MVDSIDISLFASIIETILNNTSYKGISHQHLPRAIRLAIDNNNLSENGILKFKSSVSPIDLSSIEIAHRVLPSRKRQLLDLITWILPMFPISGKDHLTYNIIVKSSVGNGTTFFIDQLYKILKSLDSKNQNIQIFDPEKFRSGQISYPRNSLIISDGLNGIKKNMVKLCFIIFVTDDKQIEDIKSSIIGTTLIYSLDDLDANDILKIIEYENLFNISKKAPIIKSDIDLLLKNKLSPKDIITAIQVSSSITEHMYGTVNDCRPEILYKTAEKLGVKSNKVMPLNKIYTYLTNKVYGQESAINDIYLRIIAKEYGLVDINRPAIVSLFIGPSGVGKTLLAKELANVLYGTPELIKVDMNQYSEGHSHSNLFGSPPGYVGHGSDTTFVKDIKRLKGTVILFDEIEKASKLVKDSILNLLDEGQFSTGRGERIDIRNCVIILTSNAMTNGSKSKIGIYDSNSDKDYNSEDIRNILSKTDFSPEFINRLDSICKFKLLDKKAATSIIIRELNSIKENLALKSIEFIYGKNNIKNILETYNKSFGGRAIVRSVNTIREYAMYDIMESIKKGKILTNVTAKEI